MPMIRCPLCLEDKELVKSHLIPRAMYDYCRTADSEPVVLTTQVMMKTSRQLQDHLLCKSCEDLLNEGGERWLLPLLARIDQTFPLLDIIEKFPPDQVRLFLRGEAPFPGHMGLVVGILPRDKALISFNRPYRASAEGYHNFLFYIPGVQFVLTVGKKIPTDTRDVCFASNWAHPILVADFSEDVKGLFRRIVSKAHKSRNLVRYLNDKKRNSSLPPK